MRTKNIYFLAGIIVSIMTGFFLPACSTETPNVIQGYVEADFVYVASPSSGRLENLAVKRGDTVIKGQLLFELEKDPEKLRVDEAKNQLIKAQKQLGDLQKGLRPTEIDALEEKLKETRSTLKLSEIEFNRRKKLYESETISKSEYDLARNEYDRSLHQVKKIEADLKTARMGSRDDLVSAAFSQVKAAQSLFEQTQWKLSQKKQTAKNSAIVFDTLYQEGEWVAAGRPIISLLPPENKKVRFYVPQRTAGTLSIGQPVKVSWDGCRKAVTAVIRFISPKVEYTPPVIYSSQSRSKLVIMIEAFPQKLDCSDLHPGQPVDVILPAGA